MGWPKTWSEWVGIYGGVLSTLLFAAKGVASWREYKRQRVTVSLDRRDLVALAQPGKPQAPIMDWNEVERLAHGVPLDIVRWSIVNRTGDPVTITSYGLQHRPWYRWLRLPKLKGTGWLLPLDPGLGLGQQLPMTVPHQEGKDIVFRTLALAGRGVIPLHRRLQGYVGLSTGDTVRSNRIRLATRKERKELIERAALEDKTAK